MVNVRNDQYLFKSVGFDEALRLLPVSAILFGASGCAAALSNFQWKDRRELWPKAVPKTRDQSCSRICVLKNCSNFLEMTQNCPSVMKLLDKHCCLLVAALG